MITILIPCHNYSHFLDRCLSSIDLENDYISKILIINDSSTDNFNNVATKLKKRSKKISILNVKFKSLVKTINFSISHIKTFYFTRIDPDDEYHKDFFKKLLPYHKKNNPDFLYGDLIKIKKKRKYYICQKNNLFNKYFKHPLSNATVLNTEIFKKIGLLDENIKFKDDYYLWLKLLQFKVNIKYLPCLTFNYYIHGKNMSLNFVNKKITSLKLFLNFICHI